MAPLALVRIGLVAGLLTVVALAAPAHADVSGGCDGEATIDGVRYTPANDSPSDPVVIPDADGVMVPWSGAAPFDNNGHSGELRLHIGPGTVRLAEWADDNGDEPNSSTSEGVYALDDLREDLPFAVRGLYRVSGTHQSDGGTCTGFVMIRFDGSALVSPVTQGAAGLGLLSTIGLVFAGMVTSSAAAAGQAHGRRWLGAVSGLLLGVAAAVLLQQTSVWPLDNLTTIGLPLLAALLGALVGWWGPFARGRLPVTAAGPLGEPPTAAAPPEDPDPVVDDLLESRQASAQREAVMRRFLESSLDVEVQLPPPDSDHDARLDFFRSLRQLHVDERRAAIDAYRALEGREWASLTPLEREFKREFDAALMELGLRGSLGSDMLADLLMSGDGSPAPATTAPSTPDTAQDSVADDLSPIVVLPDDE